MTAREKEMQDRINDLQKLLLKKTEGKGQHLEYLQERLEETMAEAKRHFNNYIQVRYVIPALIHRNMHTAFLESRLNLTTVQGGVKGQKLHNDILGVLKKNLEAAEQALNQEREALKLDLAKVILSYDIYRTKLK